VRIADGTVETILTGTVSCDPVRRTAWGTIIVGEEAGPTTSPATPGGWLLEIISPLQTTHVHFDRVTGLLSGPDAGNVATRPAVGRLAFEGIALYPNGSCTTVTKTVQIRARPAARTSSSFRAFRGPAARRSRISFSPRSSPAKSMDCVWASAAGTPPLPTATLKLSGYYRPEDADIDLKALAAGLVRWCANNTGNEGEDHNWGETICVTDGSFAEATANTATPEVQYLVIGSPDLAMPDNIAYQPGRGNWIIHEDGDGPAVGRNNDLWSCQDDGEDADTLSDGCVRIATLNDLNAEWTGGIFDATGTRFFVSVQHNVTGHGVILEITGWR